MSLAVRVYGPKVLGILNITMLGLMLVLVLLLSPKGDICAHAG